MADPTVPVSVVIPTWQRRSHLRKTLTKLCVCTPTPDEIIVHADGGDHETVPWLRENHPEVRTLSSSQQLGPGGGRNRLLSAAKNDYVASFDDDSYPIDRDYFERLIAAFARHPSAGILASTVIHRNETEVPAEEDAQPVADFIGCGCAYRQAAWHDTTGYIPLPIAYGMEEADLSLQMLDAGWEIIHDRRLRVFHDTDLSHHQDPEKTAASIANRALLAYLRYPPQYLPLGIAQYLNRIRWSIQTGRLKGIEQGLWRTLTLLWEHRQLRSPVSHQAMKRHRQLHTDSTE